MMEANEFKHTAVNLIAQLLSLIDRDEYEPLGVGHDCVRYPDDCDATCKEHERYHKFVDNALMFLENHDPGVVIPVGIATKFIQCYDENSDVTVAFRPAIDGRPIPRILLFKAVLQLENGLSNKDFGEGSWRTELKNLLSQLKEILGVKTETS